MKKVNITIALHEEDNQIVFDENNNVDITFEGLLYLNQLVKASIFMPDKIFVDGEYKENPYVVHNKDGSIAEVRATSVCLANVNGSKISASATVRLNVDIYFLNEILKIVSADRKAGNIVKRGTIVDDDNKLILNINNSLDVYANLTNPDICAAISNYVNNKTYGERLAISFSQRNALKKIPSFCNPLTDIQGVVGSRKAYITIPFFVDDNEETNLISTAKSLNANILPVDLINVDDGTVMDINEVQFRSFNNGIDKAQYDEEVINAERKILGRECKKLDINLLKKNLSILFPQFDSLNDLSNTQVSILLRYTKELSKK
ncbi:hypothetical protein [Clostridium baratii]|uniref:hypothetical protein n=1 Tax=Clostridium baratii TaxID=1561 RepID=UPI0005F2A41A|nr:hypothetical protein [Clostridium baratii]AQM58633.1 hypothetical protein NPD11_3047 [Clostridium baratii]KJU71563.1 hypothetical protein UC77_09115 [Clostridium baratii]